MFPIRTSIAVLLIVAVVLLQIFLSKRKSKWPGLIIPVIFFGLSIILVLRIKYYLSSSGLVIKAILVFIIANIPTAVFYAIYNSYHKKTQKMSGIEKMNIQDLE